MERLMTACATALGTKDQFTQTTLSRFLRCALLGEQRRQPEALNRWCVDCVLGENKVDIVGKVRLHIRCIICESQVVFN